MSLTAASLASLNSEARARVLANLSDQEKLHLLYRWHFWARANQHRPHGNWFAWLIQAGRGFGKTRVGAEDVRFVAETQPGCRIALVARTAADARDVMVEGESGVLAVCPPWNYPKYFPSKRRLVWPNGTIATTYSAEEPDKLRGPQHHHAWCDEPAAWRYVDTWDNLMFGLRLGDDPRVICTTTPKPTKVFKAILESEGLVVTRGSTFDNRANLAPSFTRQILSKYEGTRLGRQEILGELLDDNPNALFQRSWLDKFRVRQIREGLVQVVIGIDPATTSHSDSDETGVAVVGKDSYGHGYVLEDLSGIYTPGQWAQVAVNAYHRWQANYIVAESNQGGEMVSHTLRGEDPGVPVKLVHASKGKVTRAEPISLLYEQGKIHHVGTFAELEDQMCEFEPMLVNQASPDRMDAVVWGLTFLFCKPSGIVHGFNY